MDIFSCHLLKMNPYSIGIQFDTSVHGSCRSEIDVHQLKNGKSVYILSDWMLYDYILAAILSFLIEMKQKTFINLFINRIQFQWPYTKTRTQIYPKYHPNFDTEFSR